MVIRVNSPRLTEKRYDHQTKLRSTWSRKEVHRQTRAFNKDHKGRSTLKPAHIMIHRQFKAFTKSVTVYNHQNLEEESHKGVPPGNVDPQKDRTRWTGEGRPDANLHMT